MANTLESRPESVSAPDGLLRGRVEKGLHLGRLLGVPTANMRLAETPKRLWGSWAALARVRNREFRAIAHIGVRPSVGGETLLLEVHLFGFDGDLYGESLAVRLLHKVSEELELGSFEELERKVHDDVRRVTQFFARADGATP